MESESREKKLINKKRQKYVHKEFGKKARGKPMNQSERTDLLKSIWEEARKKFPYDEKNEKK